MLARQKYKRDLPLTQSVAELPHEFGIRSDAFINDNPFDAVHYKPAFNARSLGLASNGKPVLYSCGAPEKRPLLWEAAVIADMILRLKLTWSGSMSP